MGFSNYSKANENNRRLRKSALGKYFKRDKKTSKNTYSNIVIKKDEKNYEDSIKLRRLKILKSVVVLIIMMILTLFLWNTFLYKGFGKMIDDTSESRERITKEAIAKNTQDPYLHWVSMGNSNIEKGDFERARTDFIMALKAKETGKRANYGLTICLLNECKIHNQNCQLSEAYYKTMQESGKLTMEEIEALDQYK